MTSSINLSLLNGFNGFAINGIETRDRSGYSVSGAGDVNGDGFDDVIIGKLSTYSGGDLNISESYVVFGNDSGLGDSFDLSNLDGRNGFKVNRSDTYFGSTVVSGAGDINGDGFDDVIIAIRDTSESYVVFGRDSGFSSSLNPSTLDGNNGFTFTNSGSSVSNAGDVNGDGFDDIIIGGERNTGQSYVVFGSSSGFGSSFDLLSLDGNNGFTLINSGSSSVVSNAGDVNGDGFDDVIIGASGTSENYVVFGSSSGFGSSFDLLSLDGGNGFKVVGGGRVSSVSSAGDVNGDGFDDVIIGASDISESYVVFGSSSGFSSSFDLSSLDGSNGFTINGIDNGDNSGGSVSGAGDVNGDGFDDLIIGATGADPYGGYNAGESYVVFGSSSGFSSSFDLSSLDGLKGFVLKGIDQNTFVGYSVSGAGDVNGDGFDDLIIGATGASPPGGYANGQSYVVFGVSTLFSDTLTVDTLIDEDDNDFSTGDLSLREALKVITNGGTIDFTNSLANNTITLDPNLGQLIVNKSVTINGLGVDQLTIDANGNSRVFRIDDDSNTVQTVNIDGLTITGGVAPPSLIGVRPIPVGGGIRNTENLTISNSVISGNSANYGGGGLSNVYGIINITNSTISGNSTNSGGGGLGNGGTANVTNSTISGNSSNSSGGGLGNGGTANVTNSTISGNSSNSSGGGLANFGTLNVTNSTISGNSANYGAGLNNLSNGIANLTSTIIAANTDNKDIEGSFTSNGNNLIGNGDGGSGFTNGVNGDIVGTATATVDPVLGPLQNNGGSTETQALLASSPAINAGSNPDNLTTDQRGETRVALGAIDIGAFELNAVLNQPPEAVDDPVNTSEDASITIAVLNDNGNGADSDPDGDNLSISSFETRGTVGIVTNNGDGTFNYDPNAQFEFLNDGETSTDSFTYTINDGNGGTDTATVNITINGVTDSTIPDAVDDTVSTDENTAIPAINVLTNDSDPDGDSLSITSFETLGTVGIVTNNGDGTFNYDPNAQFEFLNDGETSTDSFTYTINDGNGGTDTATVNIIINGVTDSTIPDECNSNSIIIEGNGQTFVGESGRVDESLCIVGNNNEADLGNGNDTTLVNGDGNIINAGRGNDQTTVVGDENMVETGSGSDIIEVEGESNTIEAGGGTDDIEITGNNNEVDAGSGNDLIVVVGDNNNIDGGRGNDNITGTGQNLILDGGKGNDTITGSQVDDILLGNSQDDVIDGRDGDDIIEGNEGTDNLTGGAGTDIFRFGGDAADGETNLIVDFQQGVDVLAIKNLGSFSSADNLTYDFSIGRNTLSIAFNNPVVLTAADFTSYEDTFV